MIMKKKSDGCLGKIRIPPLDFAGAGVRNGAGPDRRSHQGDGRRHNRGQSPHKVGILGYTDARNRTK